MNILGAEYSLIYSDKHNDPMLEDCDGYCDDTIKVCVVDKMEVNDRDSKKNLGEYKKKVARHEIIHAFLFESGLNPGNSWAGNEEIVDWIASQLPKMVVVMSGEGVL